MQLRTAACLCMSLIGLFSAAIAEPAQWEKTIENFEKRDAENPPPENAVLFLGSSSIRFWNTEKYFPDMETINRGFGGSEIADSIHFADRIAIPYKPRAIVFYAGDNDISRGKSAEQVFKDYKTFVSLIEDELPGTRVIFVAIKPSLARWELVDEMREANWLIEDYSESKEHLDYVDIDSPMIGDDGKPREELFIADGLHLSEDGYDLWTSIVKPYIKRATEKP